MTKHAHAQQQPLKTSHSSAPAFTCHRLELFYARVPRSGLLLLCLSWLPLYSVFLVLCMPPRGCSFLCCLQGFLYPASTLFHVIVQLQIWGCIMSSVFPMKADWSLPQFLQRKEDKPGQRGLKAKFIKLSDVKPWHLRCLLSDMKGFF